MTNMKQVISVLKENGIAFTEMEPMCKHTTFRIGGKCDLFIRPKSLQEIQFSVQVCKKEGLPYIVIGKGSDLLVSDQGIRGAVIALNTSFSNIELLDENTIVCESGASLSKVCVFALENSLTGLEFAYGIPGTIGGAIYMNAGAYGGEMVDVVEKCEHIDRHGQFAFFEKGELGFSYRKSVYSQDDDYIITKIYIKLKKGNPVDIKKKMDNLYNRRKSKQPLEYPSAGSTFKRPHGSYASALIDQCGLKGLHINDAEVSTKHAGFIINKNKATCSDVLQLIHEVKSVVKRQTGFTLECEVKIVGDFQV